MRVSNDFCVLHLNYKLLSNTTTNSVENHKFLNILFGKSSMFFILKLCMWIICEPNSITMLRRLNIQSVENYISYKHKHDSTYDFYFVN